MIRECIHCGLDTKNKDDKFCCLGCKTAYKIINNLGFKNYYNLREINPKERKIRPEVDEQIDILEFIEEKDGVFEVNLVVQGLHCAACVWLIESILKKQKNIINARINLSKRILNLQWKCSGSQESALQASKGYGNHLVFIIQEIGYKLLPIDSDIIKEEEKKYNSAILKALAVAGFGAGNIMLLSVSVWFSDVIDMGEKTRNLLHYFAALIALPVIIYSGRIFFKSAINSIKSRVPNMDIAISLAIILACATSIFQTFSGAHHVYFDSAIMLTFFLLIGRYLDARVRKRAYNIASEFSLLSASFGRILVNKKIKMLPIKDLKKDMVLIVAQGEKIAADGLIIEGESQIDTSLITGESLPRKVKKGAEVFSGMINLGDAIKVKISAENKDNLLSKIIELTKEVETKKNKYIRISDKLSKIYLPLVHILAFICFAIWISSGLEIALTNATAILIITCPCALALAIPIVQTIAVSKLIKQGILVKSGEALEKISAIDKVIFDKTGTLTLGKPKLKEIIGEDRELLKIAASMAKSSNHVLSKAICEFYDCELLDLKVEEIAAKGLQAKINNVEARLGSSKFTNHKVYDKDSTSLRCYFSFGDKEMVFVFEDQIKSDAKEVIFNLKSMGKKIILLSGDEEKIVANIAKKLAIDEFHFEKTPIEKSKFLEKNKNSIMVGDGLNDTLALAQSEVSISFANGANISQNIADIIIQGQKLNPIINLINLSKKSILLMKQNLAIALIYNLFAVPFAFLGYVIPLVAALAMSSSSLLVLINSLRINKK